MKILLVHQLYGSSAPSGENTAFEAETELLSGHGHHVSVFTCHNDELIRRGRIGMLWAALASPWNPFAVRRLRKRILETGPDILHVHNTFPILSPAVYYAARKTETATVLTLHNYRLFCAAGIPLRNQIPCTECLDEKSVLPALRYGCYRGSRPATLPPAAMIALHRGLGTWRSQVDAFIALTPFQREKMLQAGLSRERVHVKSHVMPEPFPPVIPWERRCSRMVFIGRLSVEKGARTLLDAWRLWGKDAPGLLIIGDGPERGGLEADVHRAGLGRRIRFAGYLSTADVMAELARSRLLVLPSLSFEGFPMTVREAFSAGVPVAASRLGALPDIVREGRTGLLFRPGSPEDLRHTLARIWHHPELPLMAQRVRREAVRLFAPAVQHRRLMDIYTAAIRTRRQRR
ncbi:MAG: hypothetical protein CSB33_00285 [Desulfobacterales bacterium]|nr:MAG: hypothetical protein CSB33_00285 [Desulfobacterales bacterium]